MMNFKAAGILFAGIAASAFGAAPVSIGIASASGHFTVEGAQVWGNSTLFEGSRVETTTASSELSLRNGVRVQLSAGSAARVWNNRLILERGIGQVTAPANFEVGAGSVNVLTSGSRFRVAFDRNSTQKLEVASLTGNARVMNADGNLLATIPAGRNVSFAMMQAIQRAGCLIYKGNKFLLAVDDAPDVIQLNGPDLAANVGNRVEITGTASTERPSVEPAGSVLNVTGVAPRSVGGCLTAAASINGQTTVTPNATTPTTAAGNTTASPAQSTQAAKTGGLSKGAKIGIIAAVGGGGAGAAFALAGKKKSTSQ
jgi:hypothetical protein